MHKIFFIILSLFSLQAFALDPENSDKMIRILVDNGISPSAVQEASIYCKSSEKGSQYGVVCTIYAGPPGFELNSSFENLSGERAKELSELLKHFNVMPREKKSLQSAHISCQLPKENLDNRPSCVVLQQYEMSDY